MSANFLDELRAAENERDELRLRVRLLEEALDAAVELRQAFPDSSWQHSRETADAADGFDERWARYRRQRDQYDRARQGTPRPSVPRALRSVPPDSGSQHE